MQESPVDRAVTVRERDPRSRMGQRSRGATNLKLHWFMRLADVGSVSRPQSYTFEPFGSKTASWRPTLLLG